MEMLFDVVLTAEEWTPGNGMLTAAMKVNRGNVREVFKESIEVSFLSFWHFNFGILMVDFITDIFCLSFFFCVGVC